MGGRVTIALGFLPQELLGTSLYEYVGGMEVSAVARTHKTALLRRVPLHTPTYAHRRKDGSYIRIQTHFKPFRYVAFPKPRTCFYMTLFCT
jgi:aryl hydrocarbon receptor nuclear translocator-like protein 1